MATELREVERRQEAVRVEIAAAGVPEPVPALHPNLAALYRRRVEVLEEALADPATMLAASEALRSLVDAVVVHPGERRGEVSVSLRGDLAAFLHAAQGDSNPNGKTAVLRVENGRSGMGREVLATLDAGTRIGLCRTVLRPRLILTSMPTNYG